MKNSRRRQFIAALGCALIAGCARAITSSPLPARDAVSATLPQGAYGSLYSFEGYPSGATPTGLTAFQGSMYGTTVGGGAHTFGTVFVRSATGVRTLYSFKGGTDGASPGGRLRVLAGRFYGTTEYGGKSGDGTVFQVTPGGVERVVYSFAGGADGATPVLDRLLVDAGMLYGTTSAGGDEKCHVKSSAGCGVIFSVTPSGTERVLHRFRGKPDGASPFGALIDVSGTLYGTTVYGGTYDNGSVYTSSTAGTENELYSFKGYPDGAAPYAGMTDDNGTLFGTTAFGGAYDYSGTVFALTTTGSEHVIHSFKGYPDGAVPYDSLTLANGTLYGTTQYGGNSGQKCTGRGEIGCGTLFSVSTSGDEAVLYRFKGEPDGANPWSSLIFNSGQLYGTTVAGGAANDGSIFSLKPPNANSK